MIANFIKFEKIFSKMLDYFWNFWKLNPLKISRYTVPSMLNFSKIKVTITIIKSVLRQNKHEMWQNVSLYNPCDLSSANQLECWTDISWADIIDTQYCHNELDNTLLSAHIIPAEYVVHYITFLFQKVILLRNVLLSVNLVANAILLCYVMHYSSKALPLAVK